MSASTASIARHNPSAASLSIRDREWIGYHGPMRAHLLLLSCVLLAACGSASPPPIEITVSPSALAAAQAFAAQVPWTPIKVAGSEDPAGALHGGDGLRVAAIVDLTNCVECFRVESVAGGFAIHADGVLGIQYGLATLLESAGFRFHQPLRPAAPKTLAQPPSDSPGFGVVHAAEKKLRGIHLHTPLTLEIP